MFLKYNRVLFFCEDIYACKTQPGIFDNYFITKLKTSIPLMISSNNPFFSKITRIS